MFDFLKNAFDYEQRRIDTTELDGDTWIDTAFVNDGIKPYETAVQSSKYNEGEMVIVEAYDTKEEAQSGHNKWVGIMSADKLPEKLVDCFNSSVMSSLVEKYEEEFGEKFPNEFPEEF